MPKYTRKKFVREDKSLGRLQLAPSDFDILQVASDFRFVNTEQLAALHGRGLRNLQRRLSDLFHEGYLDRPGQQKTSRLISGHMVYSLGLKGVDALYTDPYDRKEKAKQVRLNQETTFPYIAHASMISEFRTIITLALKTYPTNPELVRWVQGYELQELLSRHREKTELIPDAFFTIREKGDRLSFFLEADRSTMPQDRFFNKMKIYWQWYRENRCEKTLGITRFRVLTITLSEQRKENLRRITKEADYRKQGSGMYLFLSEKEYSLKNPETILSPVWLSPKDETKHSIVE